MNEHEIDSKIRDAFASVTPDIKASVLSDCKQKKGKVIAMSNTSNNENKKRPVWGWIAAAAAALLLIAAAPFAIRGAQGGAKAAAKAAAVSVMIDVNPSIEMTVDGDERVIEAIPRNPDGAVLLDGMDLSGSKVNVAVDAVVGSLLRRGYLNELANSVLISVEGADSTLCERLRGELTLDVADLLGNGDFGFAVMSQKLSDDPTVSGIAEDYGITVGKAQLIASLCAADPAYDVSSLAALSINELGLISGRKTLESVETRGTSSDRAYIGREAALAKAFEHAGISSAEAGNVEIEMDIENGVMVYDIEFTAGGTEYDYEIDAVTGEVIKAENEPADTQAETPDPTAAPDDSASAQHIGRKAALRAALAHAGVSESDAYDVDIESDKENGRSVYDVEFKAGGNEYDYVIDALTGEVLRYETESASGSAPTAKPSSKPNSSSYIGRDAALDKALAHAGLSLSAVSDIEIELEKDDGSAYYDVEFRSGSKEYEYRINAVSGKVISNSSEHAGDHHDHSASLSLIGEDRAWEIALRKAGLSMNKISGKDIELDHENGVYIYELEFRCEGFEYEVKINAATGAVMRFEKELDD